jgi:fumarate hydratase class I
LQNAAVAIEGQLPSCQDTGTAIVMAKRENVYTGVDDAEWLSRDFNTWAQSSLFSNCTNKYVWGKKFRF